MAIKALITVEYFFLIVNNLPQIIFLIYENILLEICLQVFEMIAANNHVSI